MATSRRDLLKKGKIQIASHKATHIYKSHENLDFDGWLSGDEDLAHTQKAIRSK